MYLCHARIQLQNLLYLWCKVLLIGYFDLQEDCLYLNGKKLNIGQAVRKPQPYFPKGNVQLCLNSNYIIRAYKTFFPLQTFTFLVRCAAGSSIREVTPPIPIQMALPTFYLLPSFYHHRFHKFTRYIDR